jgi:hypothetical protein
MTQIYIHNNKGQYVLWQRIIKGELSLLLSRLDGPYNQKYLPIKYNLQCTNLFMLHQKEFAPLNNKMNVLKDII